MTLLDVALLDIQGASPMEDNPTPTESLAAPVENVFSRWVTANKHAVDGLLAANNAALALAGVSPNGARKGTDTLAYTNDHWDSETVIQEKATITVGDRVIFKKQITEADVEQFANISGDTNRLHLDESFAKQTRFGGKIAHGALVAGLISSALARLPGIIIYLSQETNFLQPVEIGEHLCAICEVIEQLDDNRYRLGTKVYTKDNEQVIDGEAVVLIDSSPETESTE